VLVMTKHLLSQHLFASPPSFACVGILFVSMSGGGGGGGGGRKLKCYHCLG